MVVTPPPYAKPNTNDVTNTRLTLCAAAMPTKAAVWRASMAASAVRRPMRSDPGPTVSRPAMPPRPMLLITQAAATSLAPSDSANRATWTNGTNTTSQVAAKMAKMTQNVDVLRASATVNE